MIVFSRIQAAAKALYAHAPVTVQNAMVSGYGLFRRRAVNGSVYQREVKRLVQMERTASADALGALQWRLFREALIAAARDIPFYQRRFREAGLDVQRLDSLEKATAAIRYLHKHEIIGHEREMIPAAVRRPLKLQTSGSTGTPLTIYLSSRDLQRHNAFLGRLKTWAGLSPTGTRRATFGGALLLGREPEKPIYWRDNWADRQRLYSTYHLSDETIAHYVAALDAQQPELIEGYPSVLWRLCTLMQQRSLRPHRPPRAVFVTAETLLDEQRALIEQTLDAPLFDYYSSNEGAPFISTCLHGRYHQHPESGYIELFNEQGAPAAPGELGEMVVTTFGREVMPMIRYRIKDLAVRAVEQVCPCGRPFPIFERIVGRVDDLVYTPERGWVGRLSQVVKVFEGTVARSQIVQTAPRAFTVRLEPAAGRGSVPRAQVDAMLADMRARLGSSIDVDVVVGHDVIPTGAHGKHRYVISQLDRSFGVGRSAES